jgi:tRNA nucleotidyltransferase (CCA-adding enzyme)
MKIYLVGGAVRDSLLNYSHEEKDYADKDYADKDYADKDYVVVGATPEAMLAQGFKLVGKDFPVFLHPQTHAEYALARTERKTGKGYKGFTIHASPEITLEEDLLRRDLTINAMAQDADGNIIDPFNGQKDLANKILRHVSPAFHEDPVRLLRVARFAARYAKLGFKVAHETMVLMQTMVRAGEINALVPERVWQEFAKALQEDSPQEFIWILRRTGALKILFPELDQLFGVPNPVNWHPEIDSGVHTLMVLEQAALLTTDPVTRFAALLHDLGKGITPATTWPSHHGHEEASVPLVKALCKRYRVPRDYEDLAVLTARYHLHVHRAAEMKATTTVSILEKLDAFRRPQRFEQLLLACEADSRGRTGLENHPYPQREKILSAFQAARQVPLEPIVARGLTGEALRNAIHQARAIAIENLK